MTTFYDPAKVRALAEAGDPFWKGAAWVLDQQDAARLGRIVDDVADRSEFRSVDEVRARLHARRLARNDDPTDYDSEWTRHIGRHSPGERLERFPCHEPPQAVPVKGAAISMPAERPL